jgi:hypothetical protein
MGYGSFIYKDYCFFQTKKRSIEEDMHKFEAKLFMYVFIYLFSTYLFRSGCFAIVLKTSVS